MPTMNKGLRKLIHKKCNTSKKCCDCYKDLEYYKDKEGIWCLIILYNSRFLKLYIYNWSISNNISATTIVKQLKSYSSYILGN